MMYGDGRDVRVGEVRTTIPDDRAVILMFFPYRISADLTTSGPA